MIPLVAAIHRLKPNAQFTFKGEDYSTVDWIELEGTAPSQQEIDSALSEIKAEENAKDAADAAAKSALLERLGMSEEEAKLLLK